MERKQKAYAYKPVTQPKPYLEKVGERDSVGRWKFVWEAVECVMEETKPLSPTFMVGRC